MLTRKYFSCPPTVKTFSPKNKNLTSDFTHQFAIDQVNFCDLGQVFCVCKQTPVIWFEVAALATFGIYWYGVLLMMLEIIFVLA